MRDKVGVNDTDFARVIKEEKMEQSDENVQRTAKHASGNDDSNLQCAIVVDRKSVV